MLLEGKRNVLDGIDCSSVRESSSVSRGRYLSKLMLSGCSNLTASDGMDKRDRDNRAHIC